MTSKNHLFPYLALGAGILALGFSAIFVRWAGVPGPVMAFYRLGMAVLILTPWYLRRRSQLKQKLPAKILLFPVLAGVFTAYDHAIWNSAILYTTAGNATLLNNSAPLWVALFAWLVFRERLKGIFWVGLAFSLMGAAAVLGGDFLFHPSLGWGDLLALISSLFYAGYFLATQRGRQDLDTLSYIWLVGIVSTLVLLGTNLALGHPLTGYPPQAYWAFLGAALVSQIGGYLTVGYALGHLPASVVSPTMIGQPVVTALLALPLLGEAPTLVQFFGGVSVLVGVLLVHLSRRSAQVQPAEPGLQAAVEAPQAPD